MDVTTPDQPTTTATPIDPAEASFDIVARQESTEAAVADLRSDLDRVKARMGRAARPALGTGDEAALTMKAAHVVTDVISIARPARRKGGAVRRGICVGWLHPSTFRGVFQHQTSDC